MTKVLFETHHLYYWPNFLPIINELKSRKKYKIEVSMPKRSSDIEENLLIKSCDSLELSFISGKTEQIRINKIIKSEYDVIIVGNVGQLNKIVHTKTCAVMVYHGIGLKQSYYNDIDPRINLRSVEAEERFRRLEKDGHSNLVLTGFTKLDRLHDLEVINILKMKEEMELDKTKKNILYAPSFYPSSLEKLAPELGLLSKDYNIIIKLHGFSWEQKRYMYQSKICTDLDKKFSCIKLLSNTKYDIIPYYRIADLLISDISSTLFEFLPLNRPIIQANCFSLRLKHKIFQSRFWKKMDVDRMLDLDFAYTISDSSELYSRVQFALDYPDEMCSIREKAMRSYLYKFDGKASFRLVNAIEQKIE